MYVAIVVAGAVVAFVVLGAWLIWSFVNAPVDPTWADGDGDE